MYKYIYTALALSFITFLGCSYLIGIPSAAPFCLAVLNAVIVICTGVIVENVKKEAKKIREILQPPTDVDKT